MSKYSGISYRILIIGFILAVLFNGCLTPSLIITKEQKKGDNYFNDHHYEPAIEHYKKCIDASSQLGIYRNQDMEADVNRKIANAYELKGNYEQALLYIKQAMVLDSSLNNKLEIIENNRHLGRIYLYSGNYRKGMKYLERSLELGEGMENSYKNINKLSIADTYMSLGQIYSVIGNFKTSISSSEKALQLYKEIENSRGLIEAYLNLGNIYIDLGEIEKARSMILHSEKLADKESYTTARQHQSLGEIYSASGEHEEALRHKLTALKEAQKANILPQIVWASVGVGDIYRTIGDFKRASEYYNYALTLKADSQMVAESLDASLDLRTGNIYRAQSYFVKEGSLIASALTFYRLGEMKTQLNQLDSSVFYFNKAKEYFEESDCKEGIANANIRLGQNYIDSDSLDDAEIHLLHAFKLCTFPETQWQYWFQWGRLNEKKEMPDSAKSAYEKSIEIIESIRGKLTIEEFKSMYIDTKIEVYESLIKLLLRMGMEEEAFNLSERARSRAFLDMLGNKKISIKKGSDKELIDQEQSLTVQINHLKKQLQRNSFQPVGTEEMRTNEEMLYEELVIAQREYENILQRLKLINSSYSALITIEPSKLSGIQSKLDDESVLIDYWTDKEQLVVWVISKNKFSTVVLPEKLSEITNKVKLCRESIKYYSDSASKVELAKMYKVLILPIEEKIRNFKNLCIIPHRSLHLLPFHALLKGNKYLIEKYNLFYSPSSSIYYKYQEKEAIAGNNFLGMALGNLDIGYFLGLPGTKKELSSISELYTSKTLKYEEESTEEFLKKEANNYNIIHLATHGNFNSEQPLYSFLLFAPTENEDGQLAVHEVFGLNLNARLVTLSACQTGLGDISQGDELVGLSRGFLYAGASAIIVSLWSVADDPTAILMTRFHAYLANHSLLTALTLAQRDVIKKYDNPYYWAPFLLIGNSK